MPKNDIQYIYIDCDFYARIGFTFSQSLCLTPNEHIHLHLNLRKPDIFCCFDDINKLDQSDIVLDQHMPLENQNAIKIV